MKVRHNYTKIDIQRFNQIAKHIEGSVLDVGCRDKSLKEFCGTKYYVGLDISTMYSPDVVADANHLPFKDDCFDTVCLLEVLEHVECPMSVLREVARVGKKVIISVPNPYALFEIGEFVVRGRDMKSGEHISKFGLNEIKNMCNRIGLNIIHKEYTNLQFPTFTRFDITLPVKTKYGRWNIFICQRK